MNQISGVLLVHITRNGPEDRKESFSQFEIELRRQLQLHGTWPGLCWFRKDTCQTVSSQGHPCFHTSRKQKMIRYYSDLNVQTSKKKYISMHTAKGGRSTHVRRDSGTGSWRSSTSIMRSRSDSVTWTLYGTWIISAERLKDVRSWLRCLFRELGVILLTPSAWFVSKSVAS